MPDVDELNSQIPKQEWETGLDGNPRPPWQLQYVVYLINPETGDTWTFINSTTGARIAYERLRDKFKWMRALRGPNIAPLVKPDSRPMRTMFGQKMRPEFTILEWRVLSPESRIVPQIEHKAEPQPEQKAAKIGKKIDEPSLKEELGDEVTF